MKAPSFPTPEAAEYAFYSALESADLNAMMAVWEASEAIVCIHPLGPRLQGTVQVRESWRRILRSGIRLRFRISGVHSLSQGDLVVRIVYENITVLGAEEQPAQPLIATNIYRRTRAGWRMVLHHTSPGPAGDDEPASPLERVH
jgi:ketosteroid isomerase-like protein